MRRKDPDISLPEIGNRRYAELILESYNNRMSKAEIIAELPKLKPEELAEVQAKLDELAGEVWRDDGELTDADKATLDATLAKYGKNPDAGSPWGQVKARIQGKLSP